MGVSHRGRPFSLYDYRVFAISSGFVAEVLENNAEYGNCVIVQHVCRINGKIILKQSVYEHLSKICVKLFDFVNTGTEIGVMGNSGHADGCHLHLSILEWNPTSKKYMTTNPFVNSCYTKFIEVSGLDFYSLF